MPGKVIWRGRHVWKDEHVTRDPVIDVRDFGAIGDGDGFGGGTDNTQAVQDAIQYASDQGGGIVLFPVYREGGAVRGIYRIDSPIVITSGKITLMGTVSSGIYLQGGVEGEEAVSPGSTLDFTNFAGTAGTGAIEISGNGCSVERLFINGNRNPVDDFAMVLLYGQPGDSLIHAKVKDVVIAGGGTGIKVGKTTVPRNKVRNLLIENCFVLDQKFFGIREADSNIADNTYVDTIVRRQGKTANTDGVSVHTSADFTKFINCRFGSGASPTGNGKALWIEGHQIILQNVDVYYYNNGMGVYVGVGDYSFTWLGGVLAQELGNVPLEYLKSDASGAFSSLFGVHEVYVGGPTITDANATLQGLLNTGFQTDILNRIFNSSLSVSPGADIFNVLHTWGGRTHQTVLTNAATYNVVAQDEHVFVDASLGPTVVNLPDPASVGTVGMRLHIKKVDASANAVTINPATGYTIEGATSYTLAIQYQSVTLQHLFTTNTWFIVSTTP